MQHPEGAELRRGSECGGVVSGQGTPRGSGKFITVVRQASGSQLVRIGACRARDP
jgi:hypothetical protein